MAKANDAGLTTRPTATLVVFTFAVVAAAVSCLVQSDLELAGASVERVLRSSEAVSAEALLAMRALFALIIIHALVSRMCEAPVIVSPLRNSLSRTPPATIKMHRFVIFSTFTVQSWTLQLIYFSGTALLGASQLLGLAPTGAAADFLANFFWIAFEVSFTVSLLVSLVMTYIYFSSLSLSTIYIYIYVCVCAYINIYIYIYNIYIYLYIYIYIYI